MTIESILVLLIIGAIAGWLAGKLIKGGGFGLVGNIVVGIIGAIIGKFVFGLLGVPAVVRNSALPHREGAQAGAAPGRL